MSMEPSPAAIDDLEATVNQLIQTCDGDAVAALRVLVVAYEHAQAELAARDAELAELAAALSKGYTRGRWAPPASNAAVD
jgi:repressor of nif and glnA expression